MVKMGFFKKPGKNTPTVQEFAWWMITPGSFVDSVKKGWGPEDDDEHKIYVWGGYLSTLAAMGYFAGKMTAGSISAEIWFANRLRMMHGAYLLATTPALWGAVGLGLAAGTVAGTAVSTAFWGEEGKQHATDFYSGRGDYGSYFDIAGNFNTVWEHYF